MIDFFTDHISHPPSLTIVEYASLFVGLLLVVWLAIRYYDKKWLQRSFWWLLLVQVVSLYAWYIVVDWPLAESLPLYHCRMAMLFMLWGTTGSLKRYFAYLGIFGSTAAFIYPILDPFTFPHITFFTFVIGHYALMANCLMYLLKDGQEEIIHVRDLARLTLLMNVFLLVINHIVGGNYGFLSQTPILNSRNVVLNFIMVSLVLVFGTGLVQATIYQLEKSKISNYL